jgi:hypothetical protein
MKNRKMFSLGLLLVLVFLTTACAGQNPESYKVLAEDLISRRAAPAGFWRGLWHGIWAIPSFFVSLFGVKISIYEVFNTGNWYNFGFLLGVGAFSGSAAKSSTK